MLLEMAFVDTPQINFSVASQTTQFFYIYAAFLGLHPLSAVSVFDAENPVAGKSADIVEPPA